MISNTEFGMIAELDLDPIKVKLMHKESGEGWTLEYANAVEFEYRRFLYLMKMFPNEQTAPLFDVDVFWHYHILDTIKYAADCQRVFGYFLHHFPYVGLRGDDDEVEHQLAGNRMRELYEETFGEPYIRGQEPAPRLELAPPAAWSVRVAQDALAQTDGRSAWSVVVAQIALPLLDTRTAWSVKVAKDALPLADTRTAWSVKVAKDALPLADTRTAWSVKVAKDALPLADTRTAWSVKVAKDALPLADTRTAWSVKVAKDALPLADTRTAWSVKVAKDVLPQAPMTGAIQLSRMHLALDAGPPAATWNEQLADNEAALRHLRFYSVRPVLEAST